MSEWISVEERLPEELRPVIFCRVNKSGETVVTAGYYVGDGNWRASGYPVRSVSHWMPMPEPPDAKEGGSDG